MSFGENAPNPYRPSSSTLEERELFVTTDIRSIPTMELRPMCRNFSEWLIAIFAFKILRAKTEPEFASESRRLVQIEAEHVPKRLMKRFAELAPQVQALGFLPNYYASLPAIGPIAAAVMTMSRREGQVHFFATQVALKTAGEINDDGHFGFGSRLTDDSSVLTVSPAKLPGARPGIDRRIVRSQDPAEVLQVHRDRIRNAAIKSIAPEELFDYAQREARLEADDLQRRRIIRPATAGEISRIKTGSRV
ncbi:MAG: hypothetical protein MI861_12790 [Pirellulales bacterium]|nr:hypothetical protein [Pirellulales bacterium]